MADTQQIADLANQLVEAGAISVFLYGSRARGDNRDDSDWEVGAIYDSGVEVSRSELSKMAPKAVVIYPFIREDLEAGLAAVPFTQSLWLTELALTAKTLAGKRVVESLKRPTISRSDLLADVSFYKGRALDAMLALRTGSYELGKDLLVKSFLLGLRDVILLSGNEFPLTYDEIITAGEESIPEDFQHLRVYIAKLRQGRAEPSLDMSFENLSFFGDVVEPLLGTSGLI